MPKLQRVENPADIIMIHATDWAHIHQTSHGTAPVSKQASYKHGRRIRLGGITAICIDIPCLHL